MIGLFAALVYAGLLSLILADLVLAPRRQLAAFLTLGCCLVLVFHLLFDREPFYPRLIPLYLLVGFTVARMLPRLVHPRMPVQRPRLDRTAGVVSILWLALAAYIPLGIFPFYQAPAATGPYKVAHIVFQAVAADGTLDAESVSREPIIG
ncbi:MAG: hypothetical protein ACYC6L_18360, partial [Anaerolineae bacterium]